MKLAFCVIAEGDNKLESLKKLLTSVEGVFDSVHITVNGGEPDGKQTPTTKVEKWCKEQGFDFSYLPWTEDFSYQRNYNFSRVPQDTDFIIWADSDDVILNAHLLRDIAQISKEKEYDTVFFEYWYGAKFSGEPSLETFEEVELKQNRERLIKPGRIVWKKRIHETPVPVDDPTYKYSYMPYSKEWPIVWLHLGADRDQSKEAMDKRMARNKRLLEAELEDERKIGEADPRTLLYLMKIYAEEDNDPIIWKKCIEMGREYLTKSGWDQERALCCKLMSQCMGKLGNHEEAKNFLHQAIKEFPYNPLLHLYLARTYFNLKDYRAMKFWMKLGLSLDTEDSGSAMNNILEMKVLGSELMLEYYLYGEKNIRKAYEAAKMLNAINPTENNQHNEDYLYDQKELDIACEHTHQLMKYFTDIQQEQRIAPLIETLPQEIRRLPFANKYYNRYREPKVWGKDEICYFANFGGEHFEKWDGNSLQSGIGGSETAVIRLAEEWTKQGYKVTVYGDPIQDIVVNEVTYLPYYKFNQRDHFNIFIQWRSNYLAGKIKAKKFLVDLHDVFTEIPYLDKTDQIDQIMVKSDYHKDLAPSIPEIKFEVISNGI